jgi:acyl-CoA thioester hydrolase
MWESELREDLMSQPGSGYFLRLRTRDSEIDKQGFVYHAHYVTYFDTALTEYMRALGHDYADQVRNQGTDFHVVKVLVEYKEPILFDQEFDVHVRVSRIGNTSLTFKLEIHPVAQERISATGEVVWVHAGQQTHRPTPLPRSLVTLLKKDMCSRGN